MSMPKKWKYSEKKILASIMTYMFKVIHYCLQMYLKTLGIIVWKYELDTAHFSPAPGLSWQACLKKKKSKSRIINRY